MLGNYFKNDYLPSDRMELKTQRIDSKPCPETKIAMSRIHVRDKVVDNPSFIPHFRITKTTIAIYNNLNHHSRTIVQFACYYIYRRGFYYGLVSPEISPLSNLIEQNIFK